MSSNQLDCRCLVLGCLTARAELVPAPMPFHIRIGHTASIRSFVGLSYQILLCPQRRYLGVAPQDIRDYKLPTHPLKDVDIKRAKDALKNDPFFKSQPAWTQAITQLSKITDAPPFEEGAAVSARASDRLGAG